MWICPDCRTVYDRAGEKCERDGAPLAEVLAHQQKARYPLLGRVVGDRYELIGGLGQGGLGTVYLARHRHLGQLFAVKFLETSNIADTTQERDEVKRYQRDFLREARIASVIRHDAVVRVSDFGEFEHLPFLVMDYVPGPSLLSMLDQRGRFPAPEAMAIARRIAEALDAFHERRLVHRDLKPANVILDPRGDGRLTLVDLGLVKDLSGPGGKDSTHPLALRGTPGYLAPEQVPGWVLKGAGIDIQKEKKPVDARVDLYALGVIFYEMLSGVPPYPDGSNTQVIVYACTQEPTQLSAVRPEVKVPHGLGELVMRTFSRNPADRPASAAEFIELLDDIGMGQSLHGSWPSLILPGRKGGLAKRPRAANRPRVASAAGPPPHAPMATTAPISRPSDMPPIARPATTETATTEEPVTDSMSTEIVDVTDFPETSEWDTVVYKDMSFDADDVVQPQQSGGARRSRGSPLPPDAKDHELPTVVADALELPADDAARPPRASQGAMVPAGTRRSTKLAIWTIAASVIVLVGAVVWWGLGSEPEPSSKSPAPVTAAVAPDHIPPPPPVAVPSDMVEAAAPIATSADAGWAIANMNGSADGGAERRAARRRATPRRAKRERAVWPRTPEPEPSSAAESIQTEQVLERGDTAWKSKEFASALESYERFMKSADRRHPQYALVRTRVEFLRSRVSKP